MSDRGKRALPPEAREELSFEKLIATLRVLEGETVCLSLNLGGGQSRLGVLGELSLFDYGTAQGVAVASSRLILFPDAQVNARLATFDGNDFFIVAIDVEGTEVAIGDPALLGGSEFE
jgi:hypothetical protein